MSRLSDIITSCRIKLNDTNTDITKQRWSDSVLLSLLADGLSDIATETRMFKKTVFVDIVYGKHIYELPDDFISHVSITYNGEDIDITSATAMDNDPSVAADWRHHYVTTLDIQKILLEESEHREFSVYPRPFDSSVTQLYTPTSAFGIDVTLTDAVPSSLYGLIGTIVDPETIDNMPPTYGVITSVTQKAVLAITYKYIPVAPTLITDTPSFSSALDPALKHYIVGTAFRNDINSQNRALGNDELGMYAVKLSTLKETVVDSAAPNDITVTQYNWGI